MTSGNTTRSTSSPASGVGLSPSPSPDGKGQCGPPPVPAHPSPRPVKRTDAQLATAECLCRALEELDSLYALDATTHGWPTSATFGRKSGDSSPSAALQSSLASRLPARMEGYGSPEYALRWKSWDMPLGPPICALRGSARRTSDSDFGGWPTPEALNSEGYQVASGKRYPRLGAVAQMAGWTTLQTHDAQGQSNPDRLLRHGTKHGCRNLNDEVGLASGAPSTSSPAPTEKRGALNPAHSRWLQGFPTEWDACAPTATRSARRSPPATSAL